MVTVTFARAFRRHVECPDEAVEGATVREVLDAYFAAQPQVRGYVVDDEGALRRHVTVFVDGQQVDHVRGPTAPVADGVTVHVFQALSGG